jgi:transcriptional regulator with PAS, ATPase and Fis domain
METLKSRIRRLAVASGSVLVRGESGTGKELVCTAIHRASGRADRPMLAVNCAAIPRELMESQLFGHKKGAFTGADVDHVGWFQRADGGTLFLDEVSEMTLEGQAKLLRILEGHPFHPVGGTEEVQVDVRVVAATNRDLQQFVKAKQFREDLYYRLSVFELIIPPLRDRGEDIEALVDFFLDHFRRQHGRPKLELSPKARQTLLSYHWPGNVRQLRNVIDSAVVMADEVIEPDVFGLRDVSSDDLGSLKLTDWEKKLIAQALQKTQNNIQDAAKLLGIGRATLYRKLDEYGMRDK